MEVERKKRQLEEVKREQLELLHGRQRRRRSVEEALEAGEVLLDELEREVVEDMKLEQEFAALLMSEEEAEQERRRRQTTDPDQLCPTVASFVMPRVGVNANGEYKKVHSFVCDIFFRKLDVHSEHARGHSVPAACKIRDLHVRDHLD